MSDDKHRLHVDPPVCAKCKHRADAKMMDKDEPWRDWFCLATSKELRREEYNPITGITIPAMMGHDRCIDVNAGGQCTKFEPGDERQEPKARATPPPQTGATEPESDPAEPEPDRWALRGRRPLAGPRGPRS